MLPPRPALAVILSAVALLAAGCGEGSGGGGGGDLASQDARGANGDNTLPETDIASVLDAKRRIDAACGSDGSGTPDRSRSELAGAAQTIVSVTQQYPKRVYETGNEDRAFAMTQIAEEVSKQLRACGITDDADRLAKVAEL